MHFPVGIRFDSWNEWKQYRERNTPYHPSVNNHLKELPEELDTVLRLFSCIQSDADSPHQVQWKGKPPHIPHSMSEDPSHFPRNDWIHKLDY